jgi:hypothetical protein
MGLIDLADHNARSKSNSIPDETGPLGAITPGVLLTL